MKGHNCNSLTHPRPLFFLGGGGGGVKSKKCVKIFSQDKDIEDSFQTDEFHSTESKVHVFNPIKDGPLAQMYNIYSFKFTNNIGRDSLVTLNKKESLFS